LAAWWNLFCIPVPNVEEPSLFINQAAIHPDMRHKGIGSVIVAHAKDLASKLNARVIRLDAYGGTLGMHALRGS
jgi:N-acetylglutamate synthase-like GNAT family acetyltransferase